MSIQRTELVAALGFEFSQKRTVSEVVLTPDTLSALQELLKIVVSQNGHLKINSIFRSWDKQQQLFDLHEKDPKQYAVASAPGKSFHQAGRAIDFDVKHLNFSGVPQEKWLEKFWDISKPLGFTPIVDKPDMNLSESWHFDHMGVWSNVYKKIGYLKTAQAAILDVGNWNPNEEQNKSKALFVQSQLLRLGHFEIGDIDGVLGSKSIRALKSLGVCSTSIDKVTEQIKKL